VERELVYGALVVLAIACGWLIHYSNKLNKRIEKLSSDVDDLGNEILNLEIETQFGGDRGARIKAIKADRMRERREAATRLSTKNDN
jgi:cell division protein FtsL